MSDCGEYAIVIIAMLANPFSPPYARDRARPLDHCAMNVAVYGRGRARWSLFERRVAPGDLAPDALAIGRSTLRWEGDALVARLDEVTTPGSRPIRGRVVLSPHGPGGPGLALDPAGRHAWWPVAPVAGIEVELEAPRVRFRGHGYHDANAGDAPPEDTFERWSWARGRGADGAYVVYDITARDGSERARAFAFGPDGARPIEGLVRAGLPGTRWGLERTTLADAGTVARVVRPLEDGPFYARALVSARVGGEPLLCMHETLSGRRLRRGWVKALLGFRMGAER